MTNIFLLLALGIVCIYLEFFLPGLIMGLGGLVLLIMSFVLFLLKKPSLHSAVLFSGLIFCLVIFICRIALYHLKKSKKAYFLDSDQSGFVASSYKKELLGQKGITKTDLNPSGHVCIKNEYFQAKAIMGSINKGEKIVVVEGEGGIIIVKKED